MLTIKGAVAVITGGASGIGESIAKYLAGQINYASTKAAIST